MIDVKRSLFGLRLNQFALCVVSRWIILLTTERHCIIVTADRFASNIPIFSPALPGRGNAWSDDCTGDGMNWFGLQLMLVRDELRGKSGDGSWTEYIHRQKRVFHCMAWAVEDTIMDAMIMDAMTRRVGNV